MTVLVTGAGGFIGFHVSKRLLNEGFDIIGFDNLNNYYDTNLKKTRINILKKIADSKNNNFQLIEDDLENKKSLNLAFEGKSSSKQNLNIAPPKKVIHLAAQAGVRYSLENPNSYIQSNIVGFANILENARNYNIDHLIYASSSSVYGGNTLLPFSENHSVDHPISLYAASKKANELMAHSYSHLFDIPATGLRFFTVYGPWGRPDMALFIFTKSIIENKPIYLFNNGNMIRDFTYVDDIVESIRRLLDKPPVKNPDFNTEYPDPSSSWAPHKIFNIGNSSPIPLLKYINEIEIALDKKAIKEMKPMQPGDVSATNADTSLLEKWVKFKPKTPIREGISNFVKWYKDFYN